MYFEDLSVGQRFGGTSYEIPRDEMLAYASKWDPRPIHLDERAGEAAGFGGVIASGSYTLSIFTLLTLQAREKDGQHAVIAALSSDMRMPKPVRAGDTLTLDAEIVSKRESRSRPDAGILTTRSKLTNGEGVVVFECETKTLVERRDP